mmetsp:Transcript_45916/g.104056  ORF Transcript_45916/g.104056 Transcript_45916/m.104056 type:complete len:95 (-) Transcript_45916:17-301(-)
MYHDTEIIIIFRLTSWCTMILRNVQAISLPLVVLASLSLPGSRILIPAPFCTTHQMPGTINTDSNAYNDFRVYLQGRQNIPVHSRLCFGRKVQQ